MTDARRTFAQALAELRRRLGQLEAVGDDGFEGLMCHVLVELTGTNFHLAKSGHQDGSDVRNLPSNGLIVGLEAKRYGPTTRLPVDQLKAKIVDAADQAAPVDLWILAATRTITITDREMLAATGDRSGIKVLVFDWPSGRTAFPPLAVLLAAAPRVVAAHLGDDAELAGVLSAIQSHPSYTDTLQRSLDELTAPDVGFDAASRATAQWLAEAQASEANSRSRLGGFNNLQSDGVFVAARPALFEALDAWWDSDDGSLALLGDEGVGKTWTALAWRSARETAGHVAPLTVFVPAREADGRDAETLLASALARQTGRKDEAFWRKRLQLWKSGGLAGGSILLILDGLNQNWARSDWADYLQPLFEDAWAGRIKVLMTCWPDSWLALEGLAPLTPPPRTLPVPIFSNEELDQILESHGQTRADFSMDVLELMRVPRLSLLALSHRAELERSGDITAERLAYEDWKHRIRRGSASPGLSDAEFKSFVGELGVQLGAQVDTLSVSRWDLLDRLGRDSGADRAHLSTTLNELVAGRWLEPGETRNLFKLNKTLAPYALGLALAAQVRSLTDEEAAKAVIAEFLDPFKGQSLGVAIVRAAATAALLDPVAGRPVRRALVVRWLSEQNFSRADFQAWWRILGSDVHLFCDLAESWWLDHSQAGGLFVDEILIKGFANACEFEDVARQVELRAARWLGWVWPEFDRQRAGQSYASDAFVRGHRQMVTSNLEAWMGQPDVADWPLIELRDSGDISWLSHRVFGIISYTRVAPFVSAITAWAVSRSILERAHHFEELAWVVRLNPKDRDETRDALMQTVDRLIAQPEPLRVRAAIWLLQALGDEASATRASDLNAGLPKSAWYGEAAFERADPKALFPDQTIEPVDPDLEGSVLWRSPSGVTEIDYLLDENVLALARTDPNKLRDLTGQVALSASERSADALQGLLNRLPKPLLAWTDAERSAVADAIGERLLSGEVGEEARTARWLAKRLLLRAWRRSALEQWTLILEAGVDGELIGRIKPILAEVKPDDVAALAALLPHEGPAAVIAAGLGYAREVGLARSLAGWAPLKTLVLHDDVDVQSHARAIASESRDAAALRAFAESGWAVDEQTPREVRGYGSSALSVAADVLGQPELLARADPEVFGWRLYDDADDVVGLDGFHAYLRDAVEDLDRKGPRTFPQRAWNLEKPTRILLEQRRGEIMAWFGPWLTGRTSVSIVALHEAFPLMDLCRAFMPTDPEIGLTLWRLLRNAERDGFIKNGDVRFLPLLAPPDRLDETLEAELLEACKTDDELRSLAHISALKKQTAWLADLIGRDVNSEDVGRIARGWRLLGYCDAVEPFATLWTRLPPPTEGWLAGVWLAARSAYDRNVRTRHWFGQLVASRTEAEAYAAFHLLEASMDNRVGLWLDLRALDKAPVGEQLRPFWAAMRKTMEGDLKEKRRPLERTLFGLDIMKYTQAPWL